MYSNYWWYDFGQIWRQAELNVWNAHNVFDIYFNARGKYYDMQGSDIFLNKFKRNVVNKTNYILFYRVLDYIQEQSYHYELFKV